MEGMAKALKRGIHTTQAYETNMGGRLEGHLREVLAAKLIKQASFSCEAYKAGFGSFR